MRKKRGRSLTVLSMMALLLIISVQIEAGFLPPVTEAVIYPDGVAYLVRKGETALVNGECVLDLLPPALNGSLRVYSEDPGLELEQVVAFREEVAEQKALASLQELFRENANKPLQLMVGGELVSGVLKAFLEPSYVVVTVSNSDGVSTDEIYPLDSIYSYRFLEPVVLERTETGYEGKLRIRFRKPAVQKGAYPVGISYLQTGLSWSPEYIVNLDSEQSGVLSYSGVVWNEATDLTNTTVYLVEKGAQFASELSPLVYFPTDQGYVAKRAELTAMGLRTAAELANGSSSSTVDAASLIMYKHNNAVTLKKGERIQLPLYRGAVRVEPLYQVRLARSLFSQEVVVEPVWKVYRVYNNSSIPWLEGRVLLMMRDRPLGTGEFPYIAINQSGDIRVMTEPEIRVQASEVEFERVQGSLTYKEQEYAFVRVRGEITVENTKNSQIKLKVTHQVPGEVLSVGEGGSAVKKAVFQTGPNPTSELNWEATVWPQSQSKLTYTYQTYVPIGGSGAVK
ncbi:MAG TPA: DUF4139 domain-containing protein [Capillibacterium sp.]